MRMRSLCSHHDRQGYMKVSCAEVESVDERNLEPESPPQ